MAEGLIEVIDELREISRGIHPVVLGGTLSLHSPPGAGTTVYCELPVSAGADDDIQ